MDTLACDFIELRVPSKPEYVSVVRTLVTDLAHKSALSASEVEDVRVAVSEACANVVCHAYSDPDWGDAEIIVRCSTDNDRLVMEVTDQGQGFDESAPRPIRKSERNGGFGLVLIRNLMDQVSLDSSPDCGTVVRMVKESTSFCPIYRPLATSVAVTPASRSDARNSSAGR